MDTFLVLVEKDSSFTARFPQVTAFTGPLNFGLNGSGELIRLFNNQSQIIDSLTYNDKSPWPEAADGNGATLELINPTRDNTLPESWKASLGHGSPGMQNTIFTSLEEKDIHNNIFTLAQNYPNPFNPKTTINYSIKTKSYVQLALFNVLGQKVKVLVNTEQNSGSYSVTLNATDLAAGVYYYKLKSGSFEQTKKMLYLP